MKFRVLPFIPTASELPAVVDSDDCARELIDEFRGDFDPNEKRPRDSDALGYFRRENLQGDACIISFLPTTHPSVREAAALLLPAGSGADPSVWIHFRAAADDVTQLPHVETPDKDLTELPGRPLVISVISEDAPADMKDRYRKAIAAYAVAFFESRPPDLG